jgi:hypothetical protein
MPLILGAQSAAADTAIVTNSCRFEDGDSSGLAATLGTPTDRDTWTLSTWLKPCSSEEQGLFWAEEDGSNYTWLGLEGSGKFTLFSLQGGGASAEFKPNMLFRDFGAWYHFVIAWDSGQAVAANRIKWYINGTQYTGTFATETYPAQDADSSINGAYVHEIAEKDATAGHNFNGYLAETVFIDGTAYAASDFGEFDSDSPTIWKPKSVSTLTFGNNGFYLDYEDSADLGADVSGKSNDFTSSGLVVADQSQDTPVNNFATFNPLQNYYPASTFSNGNNSIVTGASPRYAPNTATMGLTSGKWYWETKCTVGGTDSWTQGVQSSFTTGVSNAVGDNANDYAYFANGQTFTAGSGSAYGDTYTVDDIIGNYLDLDNNKMYWAKNGAVQNSGTGLSITAVASTLKGAYFPAVSDWSSAQTYTYHLNFGNGCFGNTVITSAEADANGYGLFKYSPSAGSFDGSSKDFLALCTKNLGSDGG